MRRLLTLTIVIVCVLWLLFSYVPGMQAMLPELAMTGSGPWMAAFAVISLVAFVAIQFWLVYTTVAMVRTYQSKEHGHLQESGTRENGTKFRLRLRSEFFWTALPIAMTIGLAWASYPLWINLIQP